MFVFIEFGKEKCFNSWIFNSNWKMRVLKVISDPIHINWIWSAKILFQLKTNKRASTKQLLDFNVKVIFALFCTFAAVEWCFVTQLTGNIHATCWRLAGRQDIILLVELTCCYLIYVVLPRFWPEICEANITFHYLHSWGNWAPDESKS